MKTGLVLEGGANRGIFTSGVMDYLMEQGITFDYAVGTSAGAVNVLNFLACQKGRARDITVAKDKRYRYFGLDILLNVMNVLDKEIGAKYHPSMTLQKMVTAGFLGRKSGAGFYIYENGKKLGVNPALTREHRLTEHKL